MRVSTETEQKSHVSTLTPINFFHTYLFSTCLVLVNASLLLNDAGIGGADGARIVTTDGFFSKEGIAPGSEFAEFNLCLLFASMDTSSGLEIPTALR